MKQKQQGDQMLSRKRPSACFSIICNPPLIFAPLSEIVAATAAAAASSASSSRCLFPIASPKVTSVYRYMHSRARQPSQTLLLALCTCITRGRDAASRTYQSLCLCLCLFPFNCSSRALRHEMRACSLGHHVFVDCTYLYLGIAFDGCSVFRIASPLSLLSPRRLSSHDHLSITTINPDCPFSPSHFTTTLSVSTIPGLGLANHLAGLFPAS
ncbi:hypothetical protein J3F83DRAFT_16231 [Trichoderma novae-zelandiae]